MTSIIVLRLKDSEVLGISISQHRNKYFANVYRENCVPIFSLQAEF